MHNSVESENPMRDSRDQEILEKLFAEEKKKIRNTKPEWVEGAGLTF